MLAIKYISNMNTMIIKLKLTVIHIGDSTHSHDQSITCVSLSTIKAMVKAPGKPMPPTAFDADCWLAMSISPCLLEC